MNQRKNSKKTGHPVLKTFIFAIAVIMVWRGVWGLIDTYFFPNHPTISYFVSFLIGIGILYMDDFSIDELSR